MTDSDELLEKLKAVEFEILKAFISVTEKLNLKYFLMDGTMLGAVRHQGFIPWDDDIDVGMMRSDYDVFISKAQEYLPPYYFLQTFLTDPGVLNNFAKIRDSRTTFIESSQKKQKINHGIYIDIFPIDFYPESQKEQNRLLKEKRVLSLRIRKELSLPDEFRGSKLTELLKRFAGSLFQIKYHSAYDALLAREELYKSCMQSGKVINFCGAYGLKSLVPAAWFEEGVESSFEGIKTIIPKNADLYLTQIYGDYMKFPPEDKRVPHHYAEIIDTEKPYFEYTYINNKE